MERAFRILQSKFYIITAPSRLWSSKKLTDVITACVILHNLVVMEQQLLKKDVETGGALLPRLRGASDLFVAVAPFVIVRLTGSCLKSLMSLTLQ